MMVVRKVEPSGGAFAASAVPSTVAAPGRLSTTTGCPTREESFSAMMRHMTSMLPPATEVEMRRMGREGQASWAAAPPTAVASATPSRNRGIIWAIIPGLPEYDHCLQDSPLRAGGDPHGRPAGADDGARRMEGFLAVGHGQRGERDRAASRDGDPRSARGNGTRCLALRAAGLG